MEDLKLCALTNAYLVRGSKSMVDRGLFLVRDVIVIRKKLIPVFEIRSRATVEIYKVHTRCDAKRYSKSVEFFDLDFPDGFL